MASQHHRVRLHYFYPHGSTDVDNLIKFNNDNGNYQIKKDIIKLSDQSAVWHPGIQDVLCCDQEPIDLDFFNHQYAVLNKVSGGFNAKLLKDDPLYQQYFKKLDEFYFSFSKFFFRSVYDKHIILHSEKNSNQIKKCEENNFIGVYYWCHALLALDWYRYAKFDKRLNYNDNNNYQNLFNVYCRSWTGSREYRLKFLELLKYNELDQISKIKFNHTDNDIFFQDYQCKHWCWQSNLKGLDLNYTINNSTSDNSATYDFNDYNDSAFDVVLETIFETERIFLTEKILRPIACGKPFILLSSPGSLDYLKSYGFKTFSGVFDESYDGIVDPEERMLAVINLMKSISKSSMKTRQQIIRKSHKIAKYNKTYFFSAKFQRLILNELESNLTTALNDIEINYSAGTSLKKIVDYILLNFSEKNSRNRPDPTKMSTLPICYLTKPELEEYKKIIDHIT